MTVIVAVGVTTEGQRGVQGLKVGAREAERFWTEFPHSLNQRSLPGVRFDIRDSHEGVNAAAARTLKAIWQRCRVQFVRNALAYANKTQRRMVRAAIGKLFVQESAEVARRRFREELPKLNAMMGDAEHDVLAFKGFLRAYQPQIYSAKPLERLNAERSSAEQTRWASSPATPQSCACRHLLALDPCSQVQIRGLGNTPLSMGMTT